LSILIGTNGQTVTIVTNPAGIPVDGQNNTFDYPILTSVTLMCMAMGANGSSTTATNYRWTAMGCHNHYGFAQDPCFYSGDKTGQNITGDDLLAQDTGNVTCTANINGVYYTSDSLTFRISGKQLYYLLSM